MPKKGKKEKTPVDPLEIKRLQLIPLAVKLKNQLEEEKSEIENIKVENELFLHDLQTMREKLDKKKKEIADKVALIEDTKAENLIDLEKYKDEIKEKMIEFINISVKERLEADDNLEKTKRHHKQTSEEITSSLSFELGQKIRNLDASHDAQMFMLRESYDRSVKDIRDDFNRKIREVQAQFEYRDKSIRKILEERRKEAISSLKSKKDAQIEGLKKAHEKDFLELKGYFSDITHNNLDLIRSLKDQLIQLKKVENTFEKKLNEAAAVNRRLAEPLEKNLEEIERKKEALKNYEELKIKFDRARKTIKQKETELKDIEWKIEVVSQKLQMMEDKMSETKNRLEDLTERMQVANSAKTLILQDEIANMKEKQNLKCMKR